MVEFDGVLPPSRPNFAITSEFWKRPRNSKELIDLIQWAAGEQIPFSVEGPPGLVANGAVQLSRRRMFVHLLNYDSAKIPTLRNVPVRVSLPDNAKAQSVTLHAPGTGDPQSIEFRKEVAGSLFTVPDLHAYALITIEW